MKTKKPRVSKPKCEYSISITFGTDIYSGTGNTALEALESMPRPIKIVSKGLINFTDGKKSAQMMWQPQRLKRLFYPNARSFFAKQLSYLMK